MKTPGIFDLTKCEQRAVIVIILAVVSGSVAVHYRDLRSPVLTAPTRTVIAPEPEEEL